MINRPPQAPKQPDSSYVIIHTISSASSAFVVSTSWAAWMLPRSDSSKGCVSPSEMASMAWFFAEKHLSRGQASEWAASGHA